MIADERFEIRSELSGALHACSTWGETCITKRQTDRSHLRLCV